MIWFTVLGVLIVIVRYVALTRQARAKTSVSKPLLLNYAVSDLPLEQARAMVDDLIARGEELFVEPAGKTAPLSEQLGPITREFFLRYGTLRTQNGGFELSSLDIQPSEYADRFLSIGHSEDWDIVQHLGSDVVFVIEGSEADETEMEVFFPSVYHLIVDELEIS